MRPSFGGVKMICRRNVYERVSVGLIIVLLIIYLMGNTSLFSFIPSYMLTYWIIPGLWMVFILFMWFKVPKMHLETKLRHKGTILVWAFNCGVAMLMANLFAGMIQGFGKSPYSHSLQGILMNILFIFPALVGTECIRSYIMSTFGKRHKLKVACGVIVLMTFLGLNIGKLVQLTTLKDLTMYLAEQLLPSLCENILATYLVLCGGPLASIIYVGMTAAMEWFSPILPNLDWLAKGVVGMAVPIGCLMVVSSRYSKLTKEVKAYRIKEESIWQWAPTAILSVLIIWFTVGVFPIYPSAIATGSMQPMIDPGDVVLVRKVQDVEDVEGLKIGDVIQFSRDDILINHRIVDVLEQEGVTVYQTKGDNNSGIDSRLVKIEEVKGTIVGVVPKVGWPTLLFKSSNPEDLIDIEF